MINIQARPSPFVWAGSLASCPADALTGEDDVYLMTEDGRIIASETLTGAGVGGSPVATPDRLETESESAMMTEDNRQIMTEKTTQ